MSDSFSTTTSTSWFSRLGSSISGILFGFGLLIAAAMLLFWNEGRAVKRDKTLKEGAGLVVSVASDAVNQANDQKLVHMSGQAVVGDTLSDDTFKVSVKAIRLNRNVESLQWVEKKESKTREKLGGGTETTTTYSYVKEWRSGRVDSGNFKKPAGHENPATIAYSSKSSQSKDVKVGAFDLSPSQIGRTGETEPLSLTTANAPENIEFGTDVTFVDGIMYIGSSTHDTLGDVRVSFEVAKPTVISLVAQQTAKTFQPFRTSVGGTISLLTTGNKPAAAMFEKAVSDNNVMTWILRGVGFFMMFIGFKLILGVFAVIGSVVPIFGNIIGAAVTLVSLLLALCISFVIIAIAWIFYRPLLGMALLAIGIAAGVLAIMRAKKAPDADINPAGH